MQGVSEKDVATREVLQTILAGEEEQPFNRQVNLNFKLMSNTIDHLFLKSLLCSDRQYSAHRGM